MVVDVVVVDVVVVVVVVVEVVVVVVVDVVVVVGAFVVVVSGGAKSAKAFGSGDNAGGVEGDCPSLNVIGDHVPAVPAVGLALNGFLIWTSQINRFLRSSPTRTVF